MKSASPSPAAASVTRLEGTPPSVNRTVKGATPAAGIGMRDGTGVGDVKTLTATLCLAVVPSDRVRVAVSTVVSTVNRSWTAKTGPCTAATIPLSHPHLLPTGIHRPSYEQQHRRHGR